MRLFFRIAAISLAVLFLAALFLLFTEAFVIIGLLALPLLAMRYGNRFFIVIASLVAVVGLVLHFNGFKLYGSARIVTTPPLPNARTLASLQPPNQLCFTNGETMTLADVYFPTSVDLSDISGKGDTFSSDARIFKLLIALGHNHGTPSINIQTDATGHAITQRRMNYWCGNSFFPTLLPQRLPSHDTVDLGLTLVLAGLALPSDQPGDDRGYRKKLLENLSRSQDSSYYFVTAKIPSQDATAIALGRSLATTDSRYFVAGAYLLIAAQDTESYPALRREVLNRIGINNRDYNEAAQIRSEDFNTILAWSNADEARRQFLPISFKTGSYGPSWPSASMSLACHGDLQGFDAAMQRMADPSSAGNERRSLDATLKFIFRFPEKAPYFLEWYQSIRPSLKSGRDQFGQLAFWLDQGGPFDSEYFASMPKMPTAIP